MSSSPLRAFHRIIRSRQQPLLFGMIHTPALPGTPKATLGIGELVERVAEETEIYAKCGIDGIILENMHDVPYVKSAEHGPEICATMTRLCSVCLQVLGPERRKRLLLGVQVLAAANREALAVALAAEFDFIRAESYVFGHVADEGWMDGCAGDLLRYRRSIGADHIAVLVDVKKKHCSHAITADVNVTEMASAAEFFLADGVILTGKSTGCAASPTELKEVQSKCSLPILIGSGITAENVDNFELANGFIVGSDFKKDGNWDNEIDQSRVESLIEKVHFLKR